MRIPFRVMGARVCRRVVGAVVLLLVLAGCGSHGVPPDTWAKRVCQALTPWSSTVSRLTATTQSQMKKVKTPDQAKINLVGLLDEEATASRRARDKLLAAGVPDVDGGKKIANEFGDALASAQHSYTTARNRIRKLHTSDPKAFYRGVTRAIDALNKQYSAGALDTSKVHSRRLQKSFDTVPECQ